MYIRSCTSENQKPVYYLVNTSITGTSPDRYQDVFSGPRPGWQRKLGNWYNIG